MVRGVSARLAVSHGSTGTWPVAALPVTQPAREMPGARTKQPWALAQNRSKRKARVRIVDPGLATATRFVRTHTLVTHFWQRRTMEALPDGRVRRTAWNVPSFVPQSVHGPRVTLLSPELTFPTFAIVLSPWSPLQTPCPCAHPGRGDGSGGNLAPATPHTGRLSAGMGGGTSSSPATGAKTKRTTYRPHRHRQARSGRTQGHSVLRPEQSSLLADERCLRLRRISRG